MRISITFDKNVYYVKDTINEKLKELIFVFIRNDIELVCIPSVDKNIVNSFEISFMLLQGENIVSVHSDFETLLLEMNRELFKVQKPEDYNSFIFPETSKIDELDNIIEVINRGENLLYHENI